MTVEELINKLRTMPKDATVRLYTYDDYQDEPVLWMDLETVETGTGKNNGETTVDLSY